jgi:hypothetical protein
MTASRVATSKSEGIEEERRLSCIASGIGNRDRECPLTSGCEFDARRPNAVPDRGRPEDHSSRSVPCGADHLSLAQDLDSFLYAKRADREVAQDIGLEGEDGGRGWVFSPIPDRRHPYLGLERSLQGEVGDRFAPARGGYEAHPSERFGREGDWK